MKKFVPQVSEGSVATPGIRKPTPHEPQARLVPKIGNEVPLTPGDNEADNKLVPDLAQQRIDFREEDFTRFVKQHGQPVIWRKAMLCTCRNTDSDRALITCATCFGTGTRLVAPMPIQVIFQQHDKRTKLFEKFGPWTTGSVQVTTEAQYRLGFRDTLEMKYALGSYYELIEKGDRRNYRRNLPVGFDVARYRIQEVTHMIAQPKTTKKIETTSGSFVPEKDVHYVLREGLIEWLPRGHSEIPDGSRISIRYDYNPVYTVLHMVHSTRNDVNATRAPGMTVRSYPITGGAQLDFMFDATQTPLGEQIDEVPFVTPSTGGLDERCAACARV